VKSGYLWELVTILVGPKSGFAKEEVEFSHYLVTLGRNRNEWFILQNS
jgi:hypothetical protein